MYIRTFYIHLATYREVSKKMALLKLHWSPQCTKQLFQHPSTLVDAHHTFVCSTGTRLWESRWNSAFGKGIENNIPHCVPSTISCLPGAEEYKPEGSCTYKMPNISTWARSHEVFCCQDRRQHSTVSQETARRWKTICKQTFEHTVFHGFDSTEK